MATLLTCPHCGLVAEATSDLTGQHIECQACRGRFEVTAAPRGLVGVVLPPPVPAQQAMPQPLIINTSPRQRKHVAERIKPGGWFSRAFAGSFGIGLGWGIAGLLVSMLTFGGVVVAALLLLGYGQRALSSKEQESRQLILNAVTTYGIRQLADNGTVQTLRDEVRYIGPAIDSYGKVRSLNVAASVSKFDNRTIVTVEFITIDGERPKADSVGRD